MSYFLVQLAVPAPAYQKTKEGTSNSKQYFQIVCLGHLSTKETSRASSPQIRPSQCQELKLCKPNIPHSWVPALPTVAEQTCWAAAIRWPVPHTKPNKSFIELNNLQSFLF